MDSSAIDPQEVQKCLSLDFDRLRALTGDDDEFVMEIIEIIIEQTPPLLEEFNQLLNNQDFNAFGAAAHKYKSSINILGNQNLIDLMKYMEIESADKENLEEMTRLLAIFDGVSKGLVTILQAEFDRIQENM